MIGVSDSEWEEYVTEVYSRSSFNFSNGVAIRDTYQNLFFSSKKIVYCYLFNFSLRTLEHKHVLVFLYVHKSFILLKSVLSFTK